MPATERTQVSPATPTLLSIGELSERSGVPTTTLRYYDELGLVRPADRAAGRRRYTASAVRDVGVILFFREIGLSLAEIGRFIEGRQRGLSLEESHARAH
ncbi:MAG: MerR family transcriptional regulator [Actinomycetota bacterium]|nr:MerR family transcriptional regulator [Actinomycetota bacterium]